MKGAGDGVLVALHHVVLRTPDVVTQVGVTVVVSVSGVVAGHLDEVGGGVAVAGDVAEVEGVGEVLVVERDLNDDDDDDDDDDVDDDDLPERRRWSPAVLTPVTEVEPGVSPHGEPVVLDGDGPGGPVGSYDIDIPVVLDVDAAQAGGGGRAGCQETESGHQEELHDAD